MLYSYATDLLFFHYFNYSVNGRSADVIFFVAIICVQCFRFMCNYIHKTQPSKIHTLESFGLSHVGYYIIMGFRSLKFESPQNKPNFWLNSSVYLYEVLYCLLNSFKNDMSLC